MGLRGKLEAVIYAAEEPVTLRQLAALFGEEALREGEAFDRELAREQLPLEFPSSVEAGALAETLTEGARQRAARRRVAELVRELQAEYAAAERGVEIREVAGGYQVATRPEYHEAVRTFARSGKPPMKLSLPALETLAVIAYKQPVTAPEISEIRGVDSGGVLGSLIGRKLVTTAGRKQVVGRPILYKTTREFLQRFGLNDLTDLPSMEEFERMAGELRNFGEETGDTVMETNGEEAPVTRPSLVPAEISVTREEPEPEGPAVNRSGVVVGDFAPEPGMDATPEDRSR